MEDVGVESGGWRVEDVGWRLFCSLTAFMPLVMLQFPLNNWTVNWPHPVQVPNTRSLYYK